MIKKTLLSVVAALGMCFTANAALIEIVVIHKGGPNGYKTVTHFGVGDILTIDVCVNPGNSPCGVANREIGPDGKYFGPISLTAEAYEVAPALPQYAKDFIVDKLSLAFASTDKLGFVSSTFLVDGQTVVLTAMHKKPNEGTFIFKVASNSTLAANLLELNKSNANDESPM